ncbi:MAG: YHS domain protein [Planctomycetes bacterium]|nr:YHS domain protein [Planctomycetota bacterium]MCC7170737.1 YHS domain protein [Planctomycetota bacterium]
MFSFHRFTMVLTLALAGFGEEAADKKPAVDDGKDPAVVRDVRSFNLDDDGLALSGYDPVAYFEIGGGKPAKGDAKHVFTYRGVKYRFANEANLATFKADPRAYEPCYGGWCAYAMARGDKVEIDTESFLVVDGKLYLFFNGLFADTRAKWRKEGHETLRPSADEHWTKLLAEQAAVK